MFEHIIQYYLRHADMSSCEDEWLAYLQDAYHYMRLAS